MTGETAKPESRLSRREREVATLVAEGLTNREIGQRLFISERTVDGHLEHIREKLAVNTRAQVAAWVVRQATNGTPAAVPVPPVARHPGLVAHPRLWVAAALLVALLAGGVGVLRLTAPPLRTIETIAGVEPRNISTDGGDSGDGGQAINARLSRPSDVVEAKDGTIYIADYGNGRVRSVVGGIIQTIAGGGEDPLTEGAFATAVKLESPSSLALDAAGNLYMLETREGHLEVWELNRDQETLSRVADLGTSRSASQGGLFRVPIGGFVIAADGTMYIADHSENHVWKRTPDGRASIFAGTGAPGFSGDLGAAAEATLWSPIGLALDSRGDLFIADTGNNRIRKVDPSGIITTVAGSGDFYDDRGDGGKATDARLGLPFGIAVAPDGTIYVADTDNNRIREITPSGVILALAGNGQPGYWGDEGPALEAELKAPEGVTLDANGNLLIADAGNHRVREIPATK